MRRVGFFIFQIIRILESVVPDKCPVGDGQQKISFVHKGVEVSQQILSSSKLGKKFGGDRRLYLRRNLSLMISKQMQKSFYMSLRSDITKLTFFAFSYRVYLVFNI